MCSDCVCEASRLNRSYSNRSVCSEHKGQVLAHEPVEAWGTKQCTLVSRLLAITHTDCQLLHQVDKPFSSSGITDGRICLGKLRLWRVGKTRLFVPPRFLLSFLFFFFLFPPSLSIRFWKAARYNSCHSLWGWRWLDLSCGGEFTVGQVLPWDPSQDGNLLLHTL